MSAMNAVQEAVNRLNGEGFAVIDIPPGTKRRTSPWKKYQSRRPTVQELREMFGDGDRNLAIVCGHSSGGLAVLDIDNIPLANRIADDVALQAETTMIRTPGGGLHTYVIETDAVSRSGPLAPGVADLKAEGGYVLAPPSSVNGREYTILTNTTIKCVPNAREWAVGLLKAYDVEMPEERREPLSIAKAIEEMQPGNRNDLLFRSACKLKAKGMDDEDIAAFCRQTGRDQGLPQHEINDIIRSVAKYPLGVNGDEPDDILAATSNPHVSPRRQAFSPMKADALATSESEDTAWSWNGYVPQGGLVLFCAPPKTGKTTLAYHLADAVSEGRPFLGRASTKSPVLILAVEERRQDAANRARALGLGGDVYIHCGPLRTDAIPAIASFVVEKRIGLVVVDTLPRFWVLDNENDASKVGMAMEGIMALARETKAGVFLLYHLRKSPGGGDGEEIRGSGDIFAYVDVALIMRRRKGQSNQRTVKSFSRYDATPEEVVIALQDGEYVHLGDSVTVKAQETDKMLLEALSVEPRTPELIKVDADLKLAPRTLQRHYNRLAEDNRCVREGSGTKALPYRYKMLAATTNSHSGDNWQESPGDHSPANTDRPSEQLNMGVGKPALTVDGLVQG